jgi:hypothetical protein
MDTLSRLVEAAGLELRIRLSEPDLHDLARRRGEALLDADDVERFTATEQARVASRTADG